MTLLGGHVTHSGGTHASQEKEARDETPQGEADGLACHGEV